jgi:orotate phosphoribosyltransferase
MVSSAWKEALIQFSIQRNALLFGEFTLKSKRVSPYFFTLSNLINDGAGLSKISEAFAITIKETIGLKGFNYIHGPAYKGIPLAGAIAMQLDQKYKANKRWGYDRKEAKDHGVSTEEWLVGELKDGDRIILVDDVITTGLTKLDNLETLQKYSKKADLKFEGVFILLDRQEKDPDGNSPVTFLENKGVKVYSILKIREVVEFLNKKALISAPQSDLFEKYFIQYGT